MFGPSSVKPRICNRLLVPLLVASECAQALDSQQLQLHTQFSFLLFAAVKPVPKDKGVLKVLGKHFRFLLHLSCKYVLKSNAGIIAEKRGLRQTGASNSHESVSRRLFIFRQLRAHGIQVFILQNYGNFSYFLVFVIIGPQSLL